MSYYPVENNAYARFVTSVDEIHEIVRRAVSRRRREKSRYLIAPRTVERIFRYRQHFYMRIAHTLHVRDELVRHLPVTQYRTVGISLPRTEMNFVDINRRLVRIRRISLCYPFFVMPRVTVDIVQLRRRLRSSLRMISVRICLERYLSARGFDTVFIYIVLFEIRD